MRALSHRNRERLARLMALTASDREHEALAALRKANGVLRAAGLTWAEALAEPPAAPATPAWGGPWPGAADVKRPRWEHADRFTTMILALRRTDLAPPTKTFLNGLVDQFNVTGRLTDRQFETLRTIYTERCA